MNRSLRIGLVLLGSLAGPHACAAQEPEPAAKGDYGCYGACSGEEVAKHPNDSLRTLSVNVAVLISRDSVEVSGATVTLRGPTLDDRIRAEYRDTLCAGEQFRRQPAPGRCTGFLVESDVLLTAGHCIKDAQACRDTRFVFGFETLADGSLARLDTAQVFKCRSLVSRAHTNGRDFAIVALDRPAPVRGLEFVTTDSISRLEPLAAIGHPSGLPKKIASGASVLNPNRGQPYFLSNLDSFRGNSGSPVFNTDSYLVEGILVHGETDYVRSAVSPSCFSVKRCLTDGSGCATEGITKMSEVVGSLPERVNARK